MEILRIDGYIGQGAGAPSIFGDGEGFSLKMLNEFLDQLPPSEKELTVQINSGGGSVTEGFAIHDRLVSSGLEITTEVLGICGSIATIIACSAPLERRLGHENSDYYIHNPYWQPTGPDMMESGDLQRLAEDLKESEDRILNFYSKSTGAEKEVLRQYMKQGTSLSMKEAKKLGFIGKIITAKVNEKKYQIYAYINSKDMAEKKDFTPEQKSWIEQQFENFSKKIFAKKQEVKAEVENKVMQLAGGGSINVDGELAAGTKVFTVDADGNATTEPAADGDYQLEDGTTITVSGGAISEVKESMPEVDALKKQVEDLTAKLAEAENAKAKAEKETEEVKGEVVAMKKEFTDFRNQILGEDIPPKKVTDPKAKTVLTGKEKVFAQIRGNINKRISTLK